MTTNDEWTELLTNCTWAKTSQNGVEGRLVTSKTNFNNIFLPAAGWRYDINIEKTGVSGLYWSSSLADGIPSHAMDLSFDSSDVGRYFDPRRDGFSVRPVTE